MKITHDKRSYWRQIVIAALIAAMTVPSWLLSARVTANSPTDLEIVASFDSLQKVVRNLPKTLLNAKQRASIEDKVAAAQIAFSNGDSCDAAKILGAVPGEVQALHKTAHNSIAEDLHNLVWSLRLDILNNLPRGNRCEDSAPGNRAPIVEILESNEQRVRGRIAFGEARMTSVTVNGELYTELNIPGTGTGGSQAGFPGIPFIHRLVAVPEGAKAVLTVKVDGDQAQTHRVNLYPIQPEPMDTAENRKGDKEQPSADRFEESPFAKDKEVYARDEAYPARTGASTHLGRARDLQLAQLSIATGQYNPVAKSLTLFSSVEFDVNFIGGKGTFLNRTAMGPFEPLTEHYLNSALNGAAVLEHVSDFLPWNIQCNEEFLILTHPDFRGAADTLAQWKNTKGIPTSVVEVNDGNGPGPDTREEIDAFIENRFNNCSMRPSYLLLLGDAEFIPTIYVTVGSSTIGSDYDYALLSGDDADQLPDFALGRIPVDTSAQARTVVDKIVRYERNPPTEKSFYENVSIASSFQCCRQAGQEGRDRQSFIETSEHVRNELVNNNDYDVDRIYSKAISWGYDGDPTPRRYYDGTLLPPALRASHGFEWDGDGSNIIDAFNAGRFLFLHHAYGSHDGWRQPPLSKDSVDLLTNGNLLPVVFSASAAGLFDNETANGLYGMLFDEVYFGERLLRKPDGGAVGILANTRSNSAIANSALTRGFFDAVWPQTEPDFGDQQSLRRLGDILNHGKLYLATHVGAAGLEPQAKTPTDLPKALYLWHVIGDPTLELWSSKPFHGLPWALEELNELNRLRIKYEHNGAIITALQQTRSGIIALGRAEVVDGQATIAFVRRPVARAPIQLSANFANAVSVKLTGSKQQ